MKKSDIIEVLIRKLPAAVFLLVIVQPLLDVAGYWQNYLGVTNTATLVVRMIVFAGTSAAGFFLAEDRRPYIILCSVFILHTVLHCLTCMQSPGGYGVTAADILNLVRIWYLPIMTICFITFLKRNSRVLSAIGLAFLVTLLEIAAVQAVSVITGTNPYTYPMYYTGVLGWFLWTNTQSAVLSMLCPVAILYMAYRRPMRLFQVMAVTAVAEATLYFLGTRLAFASMIACGLAAAAALMITTIISGEQIPQKIPKRESVAAVSVIVLITALFAAAFPLSPVHARAGYVYMGYYKEWIAQEKEETSSAASESEESSPNEETREEYLNRLEELYRSRHLMWSLVERFGRDKAFDAFHYSEELEEISNVRRIKIAYCRFLMEEAGLPSKLFGLSLQDMKFRRYDADGVPVIDNYDVENDFHGMYYLTGITGLILMLLFLLYFPMAAILRILLHPKKYLTLPMAAFGIAFIIAMIHAYFTASILRHNNASIYLAVILAALWELSNIEEGKL